VGFPPGRQDSKNQAGPEHQQARFHTWKILSPEECPFDGVFQEPSVSGLRDPPGWTPATGISSLFLKQSIGSVDGPEPSDPFENEEQFEPIVARFKREDAFAQLRIRLDGQLLGCGERCDRGSSSRIVARDDAVDGNVSKEVSEGECLLFAGFGEWGVRLLASRRAMTDEIKSGHGVPP